MGEVAQSGRARFVRGVMIDLAVMTAIGIVLGLIGPLGSYADPLATRLAYWLVLSYAGYLFYRPLSGLILRLGPALDLPDWPLWIFAVVVASIPMAIVVWVVGYMFGPHSVPVPSLETALQHYFGVLVIGAIITVVFNLLAPDRSASRVQKPAPQPTAEQPPFRSDQPRFFDRLPAELGTDLVALEMEDHYVRVHTALGSDLVLMRMRDAIAELGDLEGAQVHRSWWVARGAVEDVRRDGRNVRLVLPRGLEAPVSRANVQALRDEGWF